MKAATQMWPKGLKKTKPRAQVLSVLQAAETPLSAREICSLIDQSGKPIWLSTVYRVLEILVEKNIAVKTIISADTAIYELNRHVHRHYAICLSCRKIFPISNCPLESFVPHISDPGFLMIGHNLEIFGYCSECKNKLSADELRQAEHAHQHEH